MNSQGLSKQLQREIKAHPVKAGVLALALMVGVWFWAPLLMGLFGGPAKPRKATAAPAAAAGAALVGGAATNTTAPAVAETAGADWRQIAEWVRTEPRKASAAENDQQRDPFRVIQPPPSETGVTQPTAPKLDISSLGLKLTGTLVGTQQSVAMINGRAYVLRRIAGVQQPITISIRQQDQQFELTLRSIAPGKVEIEYQNQPFTLLAKDTPLKQATIELDERSTIELHGRVTWP